MIGAANPPTDYLQLEPADSCKLLQRMDMKSYACVDMLGAYLCGLCKLFVFEVRYIMCTASTALYSVQAYTPATASM